MRGSATVAEANLGLLLNGLYLLATVLFVTLVFFNTLRAPPPAERRAGWPLRHFWPGDRLRHLALALGGVSAVGMVVSAVGGGVGADRAAILPVLLGVGAGLAALGAAAVLYSIAFYWKPSARKTHGF